MECIFWLIPVIAIVLLIVGGIMRGMAQAQEEEKQRQKRKARTEQARQAGAPQPARPPAGGGNELDRFLQEVQRRKRGEQAPVEPVPVAKPVEARPRPAPRPVPPPVTQRPRERPPVTRPPRRRQEEIPSVVVEEAIPV